MNSMGSRQKLGGEEEETCPPLSPKSQLLTTSSMSLAVVVAFELNNPINDSRIKQYIEYKFVPFNIRLSSILHTDKKGVQRWKKVDVRVDDHVIVPTFPRNLSPSEYDELFQEYLAKVAREKFREDQPAWEFHLVKYPTRNGCMSIVFRAYHALGDGYSFMNLVFSTFERADDSSLPLTLPALSVKYNGRKRNYLGIFTTCINTAKDISISVLKPTILKDHQSAIRSMTDGVENKPIAVTSISISLEHVKQIKTKVEGTVNDVIIGLIYYVIHLYTMRMGQGGCGKRMTSMMMFNARILKGYKSIDEMMNANIWGNHASFYPMAMPSFTDADSVEPLHFIRKAQKNTKRMKNSMLTHLTNPILKTIRSIRGVKGMGQFAHLCIKSTSLGVTNMIGPNEKMAMMGHPINNFYFIVSGVPLSLIFTVVSYVGEIKLVATMEKNFIDSQLLVSCMNEAFENTHAAICGPDITPLGI